LRFLIVALFMVLASDVRAQEAKGVEIETPRPEEGVSGQAKAGNDDAWKSSLPVRIVDTPDQAAAAKDREEKSDKHEAADLDAQQRAAKAAELSAASAERQEEFAERQVWLSAVGILALLVTIWFSIRATNAAVTAANAAVVANRESAERFAIEHRPWLMFDRPSVSADYSDDGISVFFSVNAENIGKTPASEIVLEVDMSFTSLPVSSVVAVRKFAEKCAVPTTWENEHKLIFPGNTRSLWQLAGLDTEDGAKKLFVRVLYCAAYRAAGIEKVLVTAGEVIFDARPPSDGKIGDDQFVNIERYVFYGMGFAS